MSLRFLFALLLLLALAVESAFLFFSSQYLEVRIVSLLPPGYSTEVAATIHLLVFGQFSTLIFVGVCGAVVLFFLISMEIVSPLRKTIKAMDAFAKNGERLPLPRPMGAPYEIRELEKVFTEVSDTAEAAHKKDMDVSRVKSDFISTAAHQLRTPLTGIRWALEALEQEQMTPDQQVLIKNAVDKSHDLVAIVGTLLDISSIESGKYKYAFVPTDMSVMIADVVKDFEPLAQKTSVALFYAKDASPLPTVNVDQVRIKWVLNNLVENAIRYTPPNGSVRVTTEVTAERLFVRVHDTGIGVPVADRENIFERFYRAGNAIAKENQGNGLGLYIARTIATDHGGDLSFAQNTDGPGTTFTLSLPVVP